MDTLSCPGSSGILGRGHTDRCCGQGTYTPPLLCETLQLSRETGRGEGEAGRASVLSSLPSSPLPTPTCRANPVWLDPFCRNLELAAQAEHEDDLPENLSEIADLWSSPTRTHVSLGKGQGQGQDRGRVGRQAWPGSGVF